MSFRYRTSRESKEAGRVRGEGNSEPQGSRQSGFRVLCDVRNLCKFRRGREKSKEKERKEERRN